MERSESKWILAVAVGIAMVLVVLLGSFVEMGGASASSLAAPTPVSVAATGVEPRYSVMFDSISTTSDVVGPCVDVSAYQKADIYYSLTLEAGNINTSTLQLNHGNRPAVTVDGIAVASTVATDTTGLQQVQVFGRYLCLELDTTDAATGTVTVFADVLLR